MFLVVMFFILYFGTYMRRLPLESARQAIPDELLSLVGKLQKAFSCGGWCSCEDRAASLAQKGGQIRGKEGAEAGEPWDLTMSNLGSTGSWKGSVSPAVFITQCCWTQETHFVSELNCTEQTASLSPVGIFCTRYASVLQTFSAVTAALRHTFAAGLVCRAWDSLVSHPMKTGAEFLSVCRVLWARALAHMAAHLSWLVMRRSMWLNVWVWRAEVFTQQPEHPEQGCLEEWGTNVWAKGGLGLEAQTDRAAETDRSWKQTHRSTSACLCSAKRHLQSLDHDGCNLLCWNFLSTGWLCSVEG